VEFKRELHTGTADQKAEFVKDILGLANTKASGRRWLIIGFDDKTYNYHGPPNDAKITQNHIEHLLSAYTSPVVHVKYNVVNYRKGKVGKLEVFRDPAELPYTVAKSVGSKARGGKRIETGQVFVRHGSQTEEPTPTELAALIDEAKRAKKVI
jgi:predicted HTH transcriptional regulator